MEELLERIKDGRAYTLEMLAAELHTTMPDIKRKLSYLEQIGVIRRVSFAAGGCMGCAGCGNSGTSSSAVCKSCIPENGFQNMGEMWEVIGR